jgi:putative ATP-dependent endonuclease of the OLD family
MYISNLKIKNYRNFLDLEINVKPFTVIIGENNSGKTNLLNALGLIFSGEIAFFKKRTLEVDDPGFGMLTFRDIYFYIFPP